METEEDISLLESYHEEDDFPTFANKVNKKLNLIIKTYKDEIGKIKLEVVDNSGMVKVLTEHTKSIEQELRHKQSVLERTEEQVEDEKHRIQVYDRQIGKIRSLKSRLDAELFFKQRRG